MPATTPAATALDSLLTSLHQRWGSRALQPLAALARQPVAAPLSSGFPVLDAALGGGLPRGQISELFGVPTSGAGTLALRLLAQAQQARERDYAVYIDPQGTFDPDYAHRCGVELARLFLVRTPDDLAALDIAYDLAHGGLRQMLVAMGRTLPAAGVLRRLRSALAGSDSLLLLFGSVIPPADYSSPAALRLIVTREAWLSRGADINGCRVQITLEKLPHAPGGIRVPLDIVFPETEQP